MSTEWIIVCAVALVVIIILIAAYNSFVVKRNNVDNAFASIDTQLKKRFDLIPNLVATVKAYAKHESDTLTKITEYRSKAMKPEVTDAERMQYGAAVSGLLRNVMVQVESYPQLKANENFLHLQRTLNETEEQLSASRRTYNAAVTEYNNAVQTFPGCVFASIFRFSVKPLFDIPEEERQNPNVKNLFE